MKIRVILGFMIFTFVTQALAAEPSGVELRTDRQKFSYAVGLQLGENLKKQGINVDAKAFALGAQDALSDTAPRLKPEEMQAAIHAYEREATKGRGKSQALAAEPSGVELRTDRQKFSYAVGLQLGENLKKQGINVDAKAFALGAQDALSDTAPRLKPEEMQAAIHAYEREATKEREAEAIKNLEAGRAFMKKNKKNKGVVTRPSGLQYKVIKEGTGRKPKATDTVEVNYRGALINGTEFDSSYKRNETAKFPLDNVIKGWQKILPLMKEGAKWEVVVPPEFAYGGYGAPGGVIGPNETLIFEIELIAVKDSTGNKN